MDLGKAGASVPVMMTQTHVLVAAALLAGPERPARQNMAVIAGALFPDLAIFALYGWSKLAGIPEDTLWRVIYFSEPAQTITAFGNSAPLYALLMILGLALVKRDVSLTYATGPSGTGTGVAHYVSAGTTNVVVLFSLAALTHLAGDFPVHVNDAHRHLWPVSDWRFVSPVSYWDPRHHGGTFALIEAAAGLALAVVLFRRFRALWVRSAMLILALAYVAVPAYFVIVLGAGS